MARMTVLLGVHGNGLTHLILLPTTPKATVIDRYFILDDLRAITNGLGVHWGFKHFAVRFNTYAFMRKSMYRVTRRDFRVKIYQYYMDRRRLIESRIDRKLCGQYVFGTLVMYRVGLFSISVVPWYPK